MYKNRSVSSGRKTGETIIPIENSLDFLVGDFCVQVHR